MMPVFAKRPAVCIVAVLILVAASGIAWTRKTAAPDAVVVSASAANVLELLESDIAVARPREIRRTLPLTGTIQATERATVKAKVGGELREILVREGDTVQSGQVVARIDTAEYQARLNQARGALAAAQGQLKIAQNSRDTNRALLEKGFISRNAFETTSSQYAIARANVDSAKAAVQVAREAFADATLRAPIDGIVSRRTVQPGEKVSPDNPLLDIVSLRQLEMAAAVPESDIIHIAPGQEAEIRVEGLEQPLAGTVVRINPATEAGSRSIIVYIRLNNPGQTLRSGMFAQARLTLARHSDALSVPQSAIRLQDGEPFVYALEQDRVVQRPVELGTAGMTSDGPSVEISAGLVPGTLVVHNDLGTLPAGAPVRIAGPATAAPLAGASAGAQR